MGKYREALWKKGEDDGLWEVIAKECISHMSGDECEEVYQTLFGDEEDEDEEDEDEGDGT